MIETPVSVKFLHLLPRPRGAAQKLQARTDAGLEIEAADTDAPAQLRPAVGRHELREDLLQRDTVQRILGFPGFGGHGAETVGATRRII